MEKPTKEEIGQALKEIGAMIEKDGDQLEIYFNKQFMMVEDVNRFGEVVEKPGNDFYFQMDIKGIIKRDKL